MLCCRLFPVGRCCCMDIECLCSLSIWRQICTNIAKVFGNNSSMIAYVYCYAIQMHALLFTRQAEKHQQYRKENPNKLRSAFSSSQVPQFVFGEGEFCCVVYSMFYHPFPTLCSFAFSYFFSLLDAGKLGIVLIWMCDIYDKKETMQILGQLSNASNSTASFE